ncbi:protein LURP-one-related 15-like isoform X2 [Phragmites australis]|uniref:protein LURP-one-related 15-like isoform X2 n=1 Tax=Phragmites australis TaxID=29695 RepID=UPI002D76B47D|nr:protein LURP-one-related 15-like isoform X2 [Phragmites australis]
MAAPPEPAATQVVDARFCAPEATAFAVTKIISVTGRDFTVTDVTGAAVMQVEAAVFAFQRRSLLLDGAARRPVLTMRDSGLFMSTRWEVFRGDSTSGRNLLFTVVRSSAFQVRTKIYVFLAGNASEQAPDFVIRGSYYDGACTVCTGNSDAAIAQITRQNTAGGALLGRHTYTARINPGVDRAFILALTVILDEMHHHR